MLRWGVLCDLSGEGWTPGQISGCEIHHCLGIQFYCTKDRTTFAAVSGPCVRLRHCTLRLGVR